MIDLVREKIGDQSKSTVRSIELKECKCSGIEGLEDLVNLETLSITGCGLNSLNGFPKLACLKKLDLSGNSLNSSLEHLVGCGLEHLDLSNNLFASLSDIKPLVELVSLKILNVRGCPISSLEGYRSQIFDLLSSVEIIDGEEKPSNEDQDSSDESDLSDGLDEEEPAEGFKDLIMNHEYSETDEPDDPSFKPGEEDASGDEEEYESEEDNEADTSIPLEAAKPVKRTHQEACGEDADDVVKR